MNIWGGDGDDFIRTGQEADDEVKVHGGKGDDIVGYVEWNPTSEKFGFTRSYTQETDEDGNEVIRRNTEGFIESYGDEDNTYEYLYGDAGDDTIWGGAQVDDYTKIHGGLGDDKLYGGYDPQDDVYIFGEGGKDIIRSDWFGWKSGDESLGLNDEGDEFIYGDYEYGTDALDKDLWGDDDKIYGGNGTDDYDQYIHGGDGDDYIALGDGWYDARVYGENGNDTFRTAQNIDDDHEIYGGDGDDVWLPVEDYGTVMADGSGNYDDYGYGGNGNDIVRGTHLAEYQYLHGGAGHDKVYGGDGVEEDSYLMGNDGDDWVEGGDNFEDGQYLYGDNSADYAGEWIDEYDYEGVLYTVSGDDVIYGGNGGEGSMQWMTGGYGDDKLVSGADLEVDYLYMYGDNSRGEDDPLDDEFDEETGFKNDGNDIIDVQDSPDLELAYIYGQGGNDKIIGGILEEDSYQYLNAGDGDDKIWSVNPGQSIPIDSDQYTYAYGQDGNDIIYGSNGHEYLYGDYDGGKKDTIGGDDIIYTGEGSLTDQGDHVYGGWGDDKIYGQGEGEHYLYGNWGDDKIWGGEGKNTIYGDDDNSGDGFVLSTMTFEDSHEQGGDDTLYGGELSDLIFGGSGHDYIHGGKGSDRVYGGSGEDTIWGGDGNDFLSAGKGWDTIFGGDGCDWIFSEDGGDVLWGGDCTVTGDEEVGDATNGQNQQFWIVGTGQEADNFTVIMDFWHESAMPNNYICMRPSA